LTRKRGKSRLSDAQKRARRFKQKYVVDALTKRPKKLLPAWELYLREELTKWDYLEVLLFPQFEALGIPEEQYPNYLAWAKRKAEMGLRFSEETQVVEFDVLRGEFVLRGLVPAWLDFLEPYVDYWIGMVKFSLLYSESWGILPTEPPSMGSLVSEAWSS
jgi:hypothetical protein